MENPVLDSPFGGLRRRILHVVPCANDPALWHAIFWKEDGETVGVDFWRGGVLRAEVEGGEEERCQRERRTERSEE